VKPRALRSYPFFNLQAPELLVALEAQGITTTPDLVDALSKYIPKKTTAYVGIHRFVEGNIWHDDN